MNRQEIMNTLGAYEQQIRQLSQQLQAVERNLVDLDNLVHGLDEIKKGKEILAPIGKGIFANANLVSDKLTVDIGEKTFVKKDIPETKKLIKEQIKKLEEVKQELEKRIKEIDKEMTRIIQKAQGE